MNGFSKQSIVGRRRFGWNVATGTHWRERQISMNRAIKNLMTLALMASTCLAAESENVRLYPSVEQVELVTDQALVGDGGNNWGEH
jgi:hypothetical protein